MPSTHVAPSVATKPSHGQYKLAGGAYLLPSDYDRLRDLARRRETSMAKLIRAAVVAYLDAERMAA